MVFSLKLFVAHVNFILDISTLCLRENFHARLDFERKS
jgi:hypothetical protein